MNVFFVLALIYALGSCYTPITLTQLKKIMPQSKYSILTTFLPHMNKAMEKYEINTLRRQAAFIAQVSEETHQFNDLTDTNEDGYFYKGRGALKLTGYANYASASNSIGYNFVRSPSDVYNPEFAFLTAGWYWSNNNFNLYADLGAIGFKTITKRLKGCVICIDLQNDGRFATYQRALEVLNTSESFFSFLELFY